MVRSPFVFGRSSGFTLPELIAVIVIIGILVVVAAPKLTGSGFNEARLFNETTAALRYAQSAALAMQRTVCVCCTSTTVALRYLPTYGDTACNCSTSPGLTPPGGGTAPYQITAQGSVTFSAFPSFYFDRLGRPSAAQTLSITGYGTSIAVEAESGYVH